jgi:hypothetical protein
MCTYEAPATENPIVNTTKYDINSSSTVTTGRATQNSYDVGLSMSGSFGSDVIAKTTIKFTDKWNWTNSSNTSATTGTNQSATYVIGQPAFHWPPGTMELFAYRDTIYDTYAFVLVPIDRLQVALKGTLTSAAGAPMGGENVYLSENGVTYHTVTNAKGEYVLYGNITGPVTVQAAGKTQTVPQSQPARTVDLRAASH